MKPLKTAKLDTLRRDAVQGAAIEMQLNLAAQCSKTTVPPSDGRTVAGEHAMKRVGMSEHERWQTIKGEEQINKEVQMKVGPTRTLLWPETDVEGVQAWQPELLETTGTWTGLQAWKQFRLKNLAHYDVWQQTHWQFVVLSCNNNRVQANLSIGCWLRLHTCRCYFLWTCTCERSFLTHAEGFLYLHLFHVSTNTSHMENLRISKVLFRLSVQIRFLDHPEKKKQLMCSVNSHKLQ